MKKIGYILALVLEIAALAGAYIIHYFTRRKLGMVRYLNFKNMTWERDYPMGPLKTGCVAVVAVLIRKRLHRVNVVRKKVRQQMKSEAGR